MHTTKTTTTTPPTTDLAAARYVALTTHRRDGTTTSTPVWPVDAGDGRVAFVTSTQTWKVKRIAEDSRVLLQSSDMKGRAVAGTLAIAGMAEVVQGEVFDTTRRAVKAKYGIQLRIIDLLHALPGHRSGHRNDCAVVVTLGAQPTEASSGSSGRA